jgi:CBS domain-containing protein
VPRLAKTFVPSPIPSLRKLVESTVTVADIVTTPVFSLSPDETAVDALATLDARDFDIAGVAADPIARYVTREALADPTGTVYGVSAAILGTDCVEKGLPLADIVDVLSRRPHVFVLDNDRIRWIITHADLQAPAVSVVCLTFLVAIETGLAPIVVGTLGEGWFDFLPLKRQEKAWEIYEGKRENNTATGLEDCLYFSDWLNLASKNEAVLAGLEFASTTDFERFTGSFTNLRNDLAHGGTLLDGATPQKAIERFQRIRSLAERVWDLRSRDDPIWLSFGHTVLKTEDGTLLTGPDAVAVPPLSLPAYIVSAWNPGLCTRSREANDLAHVRLHEVIERKGADVLVVHGYASDGTQHETGLLTSGLSRNDVVRLGLDLGQLAVFELDERELLVIRCTDGKVMHRAQRRSASPTA